MLSKAAVVAGLAALSACSAVESTNTTTLAPLETSTVATVPPSNTTYYSPAKIAFVDDVYYYYGAFVPLSADDLLEFGDTWCYALETGMGGSDVSERIREGAVDNDDANLHYAIVRAAVFNLCPEQQYKWIDVANSR